MGASNIGDFGEAVDITKYPSNQQDDSLDTSIRYNAECMHASPVSCYYSASMSL